MDASEFLAKCKEKGIDPVAFLAKQASADNAAAEAGKASETPGASSGVPMVEASTEEVKAEVPADKNNVAKPAKEPEVPTDKEDSVEQFTTKAATLTRAFLTLREAGLLRPELLKIACDALDVIPDYKKNMSLDAIVAAAEAEDKPEVAAKLRGATKTAAAQVSAAAVDKIVAKLVEAHLE